MPLSRSPSLSLLRDSLISSNSNTFVHKSLLCECSLLFAARSYLCLGWQFINANLLLSVAYANKVNIVSHAIAYHSQQIENMRAH